MCGLVLQDRTEIRMLHLVALAMVYFMPWVLLVLLSGADLYSLPLQLTGCSKIYKGAIKKNVKLKRCYIMELYLKVSFASSHFNSYLVLRFLCAIDSMIVHLAALL